MSEWKKLPAIDPGGNPCLNCPDPQSILPSEAIIAVGFGSAGLSKDGEIIWDEIRDGRNMEWEDMLTVAQAEALAAADPDHDWRIYLHGPMHGETYQRQDGQWICVERNKGFA